MNESIHVFWFRRDLRLEDNVGLSKALESNLKVLPIFIFDNTILSKIKDRTDARVNFIHQQVFLLKQKLKEHQKDLLVFHDHPFNVFELLIQKYSIKAVFTNRDYEPYAIQRDENIKNLLTSHQIQFHTFKDHVIFEPHEILKPNQAPYQIFTPYSQKWLQTFHHQKFKEYTCHYNNFHQPQEDFVFPTLEQIGFSKSKIFVPHLRLNKDYIKTYHISRNQLEDDNGTNLGTYLRFGIVSIRTIINEYKEINSTFILELIWREFFQMILFHFPQNVHSPFQKKFEKIEWKMNEKNQRDFELWCQGKTGFPIIDAGMNQLNTTGLMHNRVRMVVANFLCKILGLDWRLGEAYFAQKLLDFELASNNGNWQWSAGCGCDAAPYFRIFNPLLQQEKFDPQKTYIKKWLNKDEASQIVPIVDFNLARKAYLDKMKQTFSSLD